MNPFFERFLFPLFFVVSILFAFQSFGVQKKMVPLKTVYHHRTSPNDAKHLEMGKVVLYFASEPIVNVLSRKTIDGNQREEIFFVPFGTVRNQKSQDMIDQLNKHTGYPYSFAIAQVKKPMTGLQITVRYDANKVALAQESYESIGMKKGLMFRLYNKRVIEDIKSYNEKPILQLSYSGRRPRIVLDCGHGGNDVGAIGVNGVAEKDVCLAIGRQVADELERAGIEVVLTRNGDKTLQLDERTFLANSVNADAFVSIHANYAPNKNAVGIETFCASKKFSQHTCSLPKKEAVAARHSIVDRNTHSEKLALLVQRNACNAIKTFHKKNIDRKVKYAPFQVLIGASVPAILVEVGFLSNEQEGNLLSISNYQKKLSRGISEGIKTYFS